MRFFSQNQAIDIGARDIIKNINDSLGDLKTLNTKNKSSVVDVIKELNENIVDNSLKTIISSDSLIPLPDCVDGILNFEIGGNTLKNELDYNPSTWAEWTKSSGVVGDSSGLEITTNGVSWVIASINTALKPNTKYGFLYNVVSTTLTKDFIVTGTSFSYEVLSKNIGNNKATLTTKASININSVGFQVYNNEPAGNKIKLKDIRIFELPSGSQIETDFNTLSADQLASKYPFFQGIKSVGELKGNKIEVSSVGKNLFAKTQDVYSSLNWLTNQEYVGVDITDIVRPRLGKKLTVIAEVRATKSGKVAAYGLGKYKLNSYINLQATNNYQRVSFVCAPSYDDKEPNGDKCTLSFYGTYGTGVCPEIKNIMIFEGEDTNAPYEPYKADKKSISFASPLAGLPNGVRDWLMSYGSIKRAIKKKIITDTDFDNMAKDTTNNIDYFYLTSNFTNDFYNETSNDGYKRIIVEGKNGVTNITSVILASLDSCFSYSQGSKRISFAYKSGTKTLEQVKKEMVGKAVYYELAEPIIENTYTPLALKSYKNGSLQINNVGVSPTIKVNYPTNISSRIVSVEKSYDMATNNLNNIWKTLLILSDKELKTKTINLLSSSNNDDLKNKINELIGVWK